MNLLTRTIKVTVSDKAAMEAKLSAAVDLLMETALTERGGGILVTREGSGSFTVAVTEEVPFGLTRERHAS